MRLFLFFAALALISGGCGQRQAAPSPLEQAVGTIAGSEACRRIVAMEWPASWPVPMRERGRYAVFFYPLSMRPSGNPMVFSPAADATIDASIGKALSCVSRKTTPKELSGPRWPAAMDKTSMKDFQSYSNDLYLETETIAALYQTGSAAGKEQGLAFLALFQKLAEPALLAEYYRLNPDFWEWLRASSGDSLPPAR